MIPSYHLKLVGELFLSFIAIVLIARYMYGQEVDNEQEFDIRRFNYERINAVLFALKESVNTSGSQYVSATVLSETELKNFVSFLPNFTENSRRIRTQYNDQVDGKPVHGENIVLKQYLGELITQMRADNGQGTHPIVILYSYNIPCSIKSHMCAETLRIDKARLGYSLIVGFTKFFGHNSKQKETNKIKSFHSLQQGHIPTYYMRTIKTSVYYMPPKNSKKGSLVLTRASIQARSSDNFQSLLHDCLVEQPLAFCCTSDINALNQNEISQIISLSINTMVGSCRNHLPTTANDLFINCIKQWIMNNIGDDCHTCLSGGVGIGRVRSSFFIGQCAEQAEKLSNHIEADVPNHSVHCTPRELNPRYFCTKKVVPGTANVGK